METATWVVIGVVTAAYMAQRREFAAKEKLREKPVVLNSTHEVDITRWRHDGTQPFTYRDGNRTSQEFAMERKLAAAL